MARVPGRSRGAVLARARSSFAARRVLLPLQQFVHTETTGALILLGAAVLAMVWANSPWPSTYEALWNTELAIRLGGVSLGHNLREWINDALMVVFFFVVGLEVKKEFLHGQLADLRRAALPIASAVGGMVVPAAIYLAFNHASDAAHGWGIPMATDIAFALGILALLGPRVPASLRIFLLALATVDDIGAIVVIALFYSTDLNLLALAGAAVLAAVIIGMQRLGVQTVFHYAPVALLFWFAVLTSGVHATIAGVVLGLITPAVPRYRIEDFPREAEQLVGDFRGTLAASGGEGAEVVLGRFTDLTSATESPADRMIRVLHPWSSFVVLPLFALANAGVPLSAGTALHAVQSAATQGVFLGLVFGKPIGIVLFAWITVRLRLASLLPGTSWLQLAGVGVLAGIGFTVSLFIADLAFAQARYVPMAKIAVLGASIVAGIAGLLLLRFAMSGKTPGARRRAV